MKSVDDLICEFVSTIDERIIGVCLGENKAFKPSLLIDVANEMGLKCIDTKGLPFNGTTYEIY